MTSQSNSELFLVVKFGQEYNDDNEDLLILPHGEFEMNIQQYIYELIGIGRSFKKSSSREFLTAPLKSEVLEKLEELSPREKEIKDRGGY